MGQGSVQYIINYHGYVQTSLSTDIIIYVGGDYGGGTGIRTNDDGRWLLGCYDDLHLYYTRSPPPVTGPLGLCVS